MLSFICVAMMNIVEIVCLIRFIKKQRLKTRHIFLFDVVNHKYDLVYQFSGADFFLNEPTHKLHDLN